MKKFYLVLKNNTEFQVLTQCQPTQYSGYIGAIHSSVSKE